MISKKPSKQRKHLYTLSLHSRDAKLSAHVSKTLQKVVLQRSLVLRIGDTVKVMRGSFKGKTGKITAVHYEKGTAVVEKLTRKKADGTEKMVPIKASNLLITDAELKDVRRLKHKKIIKSSTTSVKPAAVKSTSSTPAPVVKESKETIIQKPVEKVKVTEDGK